MATILRTEQRGDNYFIWVEVSSTQSTIFEFDHSPTQQEVDDAFAVWQDQHLYDSDRQIKADLRRDEPILVDFVRLVKDNPTVNLTQYNAYLATLSWYEASVIRYFVFHLARGLSDFYGVQISDWSEAQVLLHVRNWLVDAPARLIRKVVFGNEI